MRITNNYIQRSALSHLQANLQQVSEAQLQLSTGLKMQQASDDPAGAARAIQVRGSLRALDQYKRNIDDARSKATMEESTLDQLSDLLGRARELAVAQGGDTATAETRKTTAAEVKQLLAQAVTLGNTKYGDQYLFGGTNGAQAPFDGTQADFLPRDAADNPIPIAGSPETQIGSGVRVSAVHNGQQVFLDTGALKALEDLNDALQANQPAGIQAAATALTSSYSDVQAVLGETGARVNQLQIAGTNLDALDTNLTTLKSNIEEVDIEEAVTQLASRQTAYQAAMLATSRVMGLTLADYLR